jgi:hypothetical protein
MSTSESPDTGDVVDPSAVDTTRPEVTDPGHPDYVEPFLDATPTNPEV